MPPNPATQMSQSLSKDVIISADLCRQDLGTLRRESRCETLNKADLADHLFTRSEKGCLFATVVCTNYNVA